MILPGLRYVCLCAALVAWVLGGLCIAQEAEGGAQEFYFPRLAVGQDDFYLGSVRRDVTFHVFCSPGPYRPSVPPEAREGLSDEPDVVRIGLTGTWSEHLPTGVAAEARGADESIPVALTVTFDKGRPAAMTWWLNADSEPDGGYRYGMLVEAEAAVRFLEATFRHEAMTMWVPQEVGLASYAFDINDLEWAVKQSLGCYEFTPSERVE